MSITLKLLLLFCVFLHTNALDCRDQQNYAVDWFLVYKIPTLKVDKDNIRHGHGYIYLTSKDDSWKFSAISINNSKSIIGNTLSDLYKDKSSLSYILYNDEPPNGQTSSIKGHTKGVVAADNNGGFWMIHSVPKFPEISNSYSFPQSGSVYGQTFLCISMDLENLDKVGLQLQYNEPDIYAQNILPGVKSSAPNLADAAANVTVNTSPWYHISYLMSKLRTQFWSFAKSKQFGKELYVDLVAPQLREDLDVETWRNGAGKLASNCSQKFNVNNIKTINMKIAGVTFKSTEDHSKWAVASPDKTGSFSCVGDINRQEHQKLRGGGTVCFSNNKVMKLFQSLIGSVEDC
ncbi:unnamed protein product [Psylliodes chrysocephalus]|uniref:Plancitoxin-1 n=1 Tax=Psylliodes chrysocephalus TaxID=3402493 RepID=A0A9P0D460_9CUCU|nr:unnamed protein product [Psylliodes chrysocephala]